MRTQNAAETFGGEDLRGALPVWSKHVGHGTPFDRWPAASLDAARAMDFVGETTAPPVAGTRIGDLVWQPVNSPSRDRFVFREMKQNGPEAEPFAVYFCFQICSPRALDDAPTFFAGARPAPIP